MDENISMHTCFRSTRGVFLYPLRLSKDFWNKQYACCHLPYHIHVFTVNNRYDCLEAIFLLYPLLVDGRYMGRSPLHRAVSCQFPNIIVSYLLHNKASVNLRTFDSKRTALHICLLDWSPDMQGVVSELLSSGADANALDINRISVLMYCVKNTCIYERPRITEELLDYGADPFHTIKSKTTGKEISVIDFIDDKYTLEVFENKVFGLLDAIAIGFSSSPACPFGQLHVDVMKILMHHFIPDRVPILQ